MDPTRAYSFKHQDYKLVCVHIQRSEDTTELYVFRGEADAFKDLKKVALEKKYNIPERHIHFVKDTLIYQDDTMDTIQTKIANTLKLDRKDDVYVYGQRKVNGDMQEYFINNFLKSAYIDNADWYLGMSHDKFKQYFRMRLRSKKLNLNKYNVGEPLLLEKAREVLNQFLKKNDVYEIVPLSFKLVKNNTKVVLFAANPFSADLNFDNVYNEATIIRETQGAIQLGDCYLDENELYVVTRPDLEKLLDKGTLPRKNEVLALYYDTLTLSADTGMNTMWGKFDTFKQIMNDFKYESYIDLNDTRCVIKSCNFTIKASERLKESLRFNIKKIFHLMPVDANIPYMVYHASSANYKCKTLNEGISKAVSKYTFDTWTNDDVTNYQKSSSTNKKHVPKLTLKLLLPSKNEDTNIRQYADVHIMEHGIFYLYFKTTTRDSPVSIEQLTSIVDHFNTTCVAKINSIFDGFDHTLNKLIQNAQINNSLSMRTATTITLKKKVLSHKHIIKRLTNHPFFALLRDFTHDEHLVLGYRRVSNFNSTDAITRFITKNYHLDMDELLDRLAVEYGLSMDEARRKYDLLGGNIRMELANHNNAVYYSPTSKYDITVRCHLSIYQIYVEIENATRDDHHLNILKLIVLLCCENDVNFELTKSETKKITEIADETQTEAQSNITLNLINDMLGNVSDDDANAKSLSDTDSINRADSVKSDTDSLKSNTDSINRADSLKSNTDSINRADSLKSNTDSISRADSLKSNTDSPVDIENNSQRNTESVVQGNAPSLSRLDNEDLQNIHPYDNPELRDTSEEEPPNTAVDDTTGMEADKYQNVENNPKLMKQYHRNYVINKLYAADPEMFKYDGPVISYKGKVTDKVKKDYMRSCPATDKRQPIVISPGEKAMIDKYHKDSYRGYINTGSTDELKKNNIYICPLVWCPLSRVSLRKSELKENKGKCPKPYEEPPLILENKKDGNKESEEEVYKYPFLMKANLHPKKIQSVCCSLKKTDDAIFDEPEDKTVSVAKSKGTKESKGKEQVKTRATDITLRYVMKVSNIPIDDGRYGTLPKLLNDYMNHGRTLDSCAGLLVDTKMDCYVRMGLGLKKQQKLMNAFVATLGIETLKSTDDLVKHIIENMTLTEYIGLNGGNTLKSYIPDDVSIENKSQFSKFKTYMQSDQGVKYLQSMHIEYLKEMIKNVDANEFQNREKSQDVKVIEREFLFYWSFVNFKKYIQDDTMVKGIDDLFDMTRLEWLNQNKYNYLVFDISDENDIQLLCRRYMTRTREYVLLLKIQEDFEAVIRFSKESKGVTVKHVHGENESGIDKLAAVYNKRCRLIQSPNVINGSMVFDVLRKMEDEELNMDNYNSINKCIVVLNYNLKVCGFHFRGVYTPLEVEDDINYEMMNMRETGITFTFRDNLKRVTDSIQKEASVSKAVLKGQHLKILEAIAEQYPDAMYYDVKDEKFGCGTSNNCYVVVWILSPPVRNFIFSWQTRLKVQPFYGWTFSFGFDWDD